MELLKDQMNRIFIVFVSFLIIGMIYLFSYSLSKPEISRINNQTGKDLPEFKNLVDLNQEIFDQEELLKGKVLLNVWASWCITCKVNERVAIKTKETLKFFEEKNIFYLEADWTNKNKLIAKKLASFGRSSIPLYIYYPDEKSVPIILPEILTESVIKDYLN